MRETVKPKRLGAVGPELFPSCGLWHVERDGVVRHRTAAPRFPSSSRLGPQRARDMQLIVCVNRTPVTGDIHAARDKREIDMFGCGLAHTVAEAPKDKQLRHPAEHHDALHADHHRTARSRTSQPFLDEISDAVAKAVRKARRPDAKAEGTSQKDVVLDNLDDVIAAVSGEEGYRFNARQLFYALRPIVMDETGKELKIANFTEHHHRLRERERRNPADVPRAARLDHASAPRRDHHARHPDGRGVRAPGMEFQQAALHREGRRAGGAEAGPLAGAARLRRDVVEGLLDPRRPRPDRQAGRTRRAGRGVLRPRRRRIRHHDLPDPAGGDEGARCPQDQDRQSRSRTVGGGRDGAGGRDPGGARSAEAGCRLRQRTTAPTGRTGCRPIASN